MPAMFENIKLQRINERYKVLLWSMILYIESGSGLPYFAWCIRERIDNLPDLGTGLYRDNIKR